MNFWLDSTQTKIPCLSKNFWSSFPKFMKSHGFSKLPFDPRVPHCAAQWWTATCPVAGTCEGALARPNARGR